MKEIVTLKTDSEFKDQIQVQFTIAADSVEVFKEEFGMTFVQYLTNCRISHSKELLISTAVPTEQIAYRVGMNSYSYFCTCFKRLCGMSPGEYRRKNKAAKS